MSVGEGHCETATESNRSRASAGPRFGARLLFLLLAVVLPLVGFAAVMAYTYSAAQIRQMEDDVRREASALASVIDDEIEWALRQAATIGAFVGPNADLQEVHEVARRTLVPLGLNLLALDSQGNQLMNAAVPWGTPLKASAAADQIREVARTLLPAVTPATVGANRRDVLVAVLVPWEREAERLVLALSLSHEHLRQTAATSFSRPPVWRWGITDPNGILIARHPDHGHYVGTRLPDELLRSSAGQGGVGWETSVDGTRVLRGWVRAPFTNWLVAVAVPRHVVLAPLWEAWAWFAFGAVMIVGGAVALALWQSRSLQAYVATLSADAVALGRGAPVAERRLGVAEFQAVHDEMAAASREIARSRARSELLMRELQHRTRNLLTIAHSIAERTLRGEPGIDRLRTTLTGRLHALAAATEALSDADWEGATIATVVRRVMEPFGSQYRTEGEDVLLSAQWATNMALALHELSTNAAKYGALSVPGGRVTIGWTMADGALAFTWQETGGPRLETPSRVGFGTRLLMALGHDPELPPVVEHHPDGFRYGLVVPCDVAVAEKQRPGDRSPGRSSPI